MCLQVSAVRDWQSWNWAGDEIVHKPIIPACRPIPGTKLSRYDIDIREFLTTTDNAVVGANLSKLIHNLTPVEQALFRSHGQGSFDFRVDKIVEFFGTLRYMKSANKTRYCPDAWLFPDETLHQRGGDCEDLAFLLAALLATAGVSNYCLRVALGTLHISLPQGKVQSHDHCWVMYLNEGGVWEILEPTAIVQRKAVRAHTASMPSHPTEYVPHYVFNSDHLWLICSKDLDAGQEFGDYCKKRLSFWNRFDPRFAASVHSTIFDAALKGIVPDGALSAIKRKSLILDANIATYDPRDHFDNGYVKEGWARVNAKLANFKADNSDWGSFGAAGHAIADFYAHSSYVHFAQLQNPAAAGGQAVIYQPGEGMVAAPAYGAPPADPSLPPFDLTSGKFSTNRNLWQGTGQDQATQWKGEIISGRYAQIHDPKATFWEGFTSLPLELTRKADYKPRGSLPHHDEIAVDADSPGNRHQLYSRAANPDPADRGAYGNQFRWRKNAAIAHVRKAWQDNWNG